MTFWTAAFSTSRGRSRSKNYPLWGDDGDDDGDGDVLDMGIFNDEQRCQQKLFTSGTRSETIDPFLAVGEDDDGDGDAFNSIVVLFLGRCSPPGLPCISPTSASLSPRHHCRTPPGVFS